MKKAYLGQVKVVGDVEEDLAAAERAKVRSLTWLTEPLFKGTYPIEGLQAIGIEPPTMQSEDLSIISQPMDFLGVKRI